MRVFKTKEFSRIARKARIEDSALRKAAFDIESGRVDADLGAYLIKQRISAGSGRKNAHRSIIVYREGTRIVFVHLFAKNRQASLKPDELDIYRELAKHLAALGEQSVDRLVERNEWVELRNDHDAEDLMTMTRKIYRSDALRSAHSAMAGLASVGAVDRTTMRRFDAACLTSVQKLDASEIREIREAADMSQAVFAKVLNVSTSALSQWEQGDKKPSGSSLKLLALARSKGIDAIL